MSTTECRTCGCDPVVPWSRERPRRIISCLETLTCDQVETCDCHIVYRIVNRVAS
jgi:hypothetical protein